MDINSLIEQPQEDSVLGSDSDMCIGGIRNE